MSLSFTNLPMRDRNMKDNMSVASSSRGYSINSKQQIIIDDDNQSIRSSVSIPYGNSNSRSSYQFTLDPSHGAEWEAAVKQSKEDWEEYQQIIKVYNDELTNRNTYYLDEMAKKHEKTAKLLLHSDYLFGQMQRSFVPEYVNHLEGPISVWVEPIIERRGSSPIIVPFQCVGEGVGNSHAFTAFGSHKHYKQGLLVPYSEEPKGCLENVYMIEIDISDIVNNTGYAVGVTICHGGDDPEIDQTVEFTDTNEYSPHTGKRYHYICKPGQTEKKHTVFKSGEAVTEPFSSEFPNLTSNIENLRKEVGGYTTTKKLVRATSAIMQKIWREMAFHPKWKKPVQHLSNDPEMQGILEVHKETVEAALLDVQRTIRNELPIVNMKTLKVECEIINVRNNWEEEKSSLSVLKDVSLDIGPMKFGFKVHFTYAFREFGDGIPKESALPTIQEFGEDGDDLGSILDD